MSQNRRNHRADARVANIDDALHQLTLRVGLALAVLVSVVAGLVRAG